MVAAFKSFQFWLFSCCLAVISLASSQNPDDQFIYNGFKGVNLHLAGNAKIHSHGLLQLTNTSTFVKGHAFYPSAIQFNSSSSSGSSRSDLSFSTNFVMAMVPLLQGGHGIAFVISPSMDFISYAWNTAYLGLFNRTNNGNPSNHIFAVEFDTVQTQDFEDQDNNHVGIDVNGLKSIKSATAAYYSNEQRKKIGLKFISGHPIQVWIDYSDGEKLLNITLAPTRSTKPFQPLLSSSLDLSDVLLDTMFVGFSAATGALSSNHYILGWSFNRSGQAQNLEISKLPKLPEVGRRIKQVHLIMIILAVLLLMIIAGGTYLYRRKKYEEVKEDWERPYGTQRFPYKTLYKATKGFKEKQVLGFGGFGKVYKGTLPSSDEQIAVKKVSHESDQGMREFVSEIVSMGRLRHRNLVRLRGYCRRKKELLLVYDYMPNGSLDKFLFEDNHPNLNWHQRYQIIKGVASALFYLHEDWEQVVLHRDIKASNVLLDSNLNGRLGDFGLARLYDQDAAPQTTRLVGTIGYLDPEVTRTGKYSKSADMFSFGAFLLEVACGRKPIDNNLPPEEIFLVELVKKCWRRGVILDASDPKLHGNYVVEEMEKVLKLGLGCSNPKPDGRPTIKEVVQDLEGNASSLPDIVQSSTEINTSMANNLESDCMISLSSSVGRVSVNTWSSADTVLNVGR